MYRPQDDPALVGRNDATFDAAVAALAHGEAVLVFPEGTSHSLPELAPPKTGGARIPLRAEAQARWELGLRIVPIGLTYRCKTFFRGEAAASVGAPLDAAAWREAHERDSVAAVRALTAAIAEALETVALQLQGPEDEVLLDAAKALCVAERGLEPQGERDALATRLRRLQAFAAGMNWLGLRIRGGSDASPAPFVLPVPAHIVRSRSYLQYESLRTKLQGRQSARVGCERIGLSH